jgi:hypothetical protein
MTKLIDAFFILLTRPEVASYLRECTIISTANINFCQIYLLPATDSDNDAEHINKLLGHSEVVYATANNIPLHTLNTAL